MVVVICMRILGGRKSSREERERERGGEVPAFLLGGTWRLIQSVINWAATTGNGKGARTRPFAFTLYLFPLPNSHS